MAYRRRSQQTVTENIVYESSPNMSNKTDNARITLHSGAFVHRCCCGKAIGVTYSECAFTAFGNQHAMRTRHIVICGLTHSTTFFHIISQTARLSTVSYRTQNVRFGFHYNFCLKHFSFYGELGEMWLKKKYIGLHVKQLLFMSHFNLLAPEFFLILAHTVNKMWIIQEPNALELWNTEFWRERNGEYTSCLKYSAPIFVE